MAEASGFDYEFKFCVVGPSRVGKTCIKLRAVEDLFHEQHLATVGPEFVEIIRQFDLVKKVVKYTLWDGPGSEKYATEAKKHAVMKSCDGALLVFDLSKRNTFEKMSYYWNILVERSPGVHVVLVGNKSDTPADKRQVREEEGYALADKLGCSLYIEVSAKTGEGFPEVINYLERICLGASLSPVNSTANVKTASTINSSEGSAKGDRHQQEHEAPEKQESLRGLGLDKSKSRKQALTPHNSAGNRSQINKWYPANDDRENALNQFKKELIDGIQVLVYPHEGGSPEYATMYMNKSKKRLFWDPGSGRDMEVAHIGIYISDIAEVRPPTENSFTFKAMKIPRKCEGRMCLFTIIASERSISMGAKNPKDCQRIVQGLKLITECVIPSHIKHERGKEDWTQGKLMILRAGRLTNADLTGIESFKLKLQRGVEILYCRLNGRRVVKFLNLDAECERLILTNQAKRSSYCGFWTSMFEAPPEGIDMEDISEIRPGFQAYAFSTQQPAPLPSDADRAVTIIGSETTLSFLMRSGSDRDVFVSHFHCMIRLLRPTVTVY